MISKNINYISKLDHLRFFAALLVGIYHVYHFQSPTWTGSPIPAVSSDSVFAALIVEGHTGVALFLILSGFIFAAIGFGKQIDYANFAMNRVLRIMPLYVMAVFIAAILADAEFKQIISALFLPFPLSETLKETYVTPHLWTIRVEFQFYLLFPFLIAFIAKYGLRYASGVILLMITIRTMIWWSLSNEIDLTTSSETVALRYISYWTLLGRLDQFVIGMVAGIIFSDRANLKVPNWMKHRWWALLLCAMPLLAIFGFHRMGGYNQLSQNHWLWIVWPDIEAIAWAVFTIVYISCSLDWPRRISQALSWLGTLSFSLYVNHWLFVHDFPVAKYLPQLTSSLTANAALVFVFVLLPPLILFSWLTFSVIERPFFALRKPYVRKLESPVGSVADSSIAP